MFDSRAHASKLKTVLFSAALNTVPFTQSTLSVGNRVNVLIHLIVVVGVVDVVLSGKICNLAPKAIMDFTFMCIV